MEVSEFKYVSVGEGATETLFAATINPATEDPGLQINSSTLERVLICNTDSEDIGVRLVLDDGTNTYHILKSITIPLGTTLDVLNGIPFVYDSRYSVKIITGSGHTCDVLASKK
tara:strand:- start:624 stop:965 length:342 start_codon:yes stop_codon:yes gene_type:complete